MCVIPSSLTSSPTIFDRIAAVEFRLGVVEGRLSVIETRLTNIEKHYATKADLWKMGASLLLAQTGITAALFQLMK